MAKTFKDRFNRTRKDNRESYSKKSQKQFKDNWRKKDWKNLNPIDSEEEEIENEYPLF